MPLITADEARVYLPQTAADTSLIEGLVLRADGMMAAFCGYARPSGGSARTMLSAAYVLYRDGIGSTVVRLPCAPITAVTYVYDDPDQDYTSSTLIASTDRAVAGDQADAIELLPSYGTFSGSEDSPTRRAIKVSVTAGFATVDDDLKDITGWLVKHLFEERRRASQKTETPGPKVEIPVEIKRRLSPYVLPASFGAL